MAERGATEMLYMASYWWTGTRHIALESRYLKAMLVNGCLLMLNYQVTSTCSRISPPPSLVFLKTNLVSPTKHIASCVPAVKNKEGRPKGTTNATKEDYDHSFNEALKCAAEAYIALRDEADKKVLWWPNSHHVEGNRIEVQFTKWQFELWDSWNEGTEAKTPSIILLPANFNIGAKWQLGLLLHFPGLGLWFPYLKSHVVGKLYVYSCLGSK